jgi:hypothetical protein
MPTWGIRGEYGRIEQGNDCRVSEALSVEDAQVGRAIGVM